MKVYDNVQKTYLDAGLAQLFTASAIANTCCKLMRTTIYVQLCVVNYLFFSDLVRLSSASRMLFIMLGYIHPD